MWIDLLIAIIKSVVIIALLLIGFAYMTYIERKVVAHMQSRIGPNRAGPLGLLQPLADGIKLLFKEDIVPARADRVVYWLAPTLSVVPAIITFAVIPIGAPITLFGRTIPLQLADINVALLYVLAASSLAVYGVVLAGWSSNNKFSLLGGLRASAQLISYELALGLSVIGVVMLAGSLSLADIVAAQRSLPYIVLQPIGFLIFGICAVAETKRAPFDLPEAEQELVAGFHTEYSGMKFTLFYMAEYIAMITMSAMTVTLFLGGWHGPFLSELLGPVWFSLKVLFLLFVFVWIRASWPRVRYDRLMGFGWKVLLPLGLLNVFLTAVGIVLMG
ncbi:MAG: NADH-quinone oxidoreductase subunit NuoH [Chloroflexi bacterium]|nr:NADH-quinone oxidoreductase subunit NuoH [Chloroflexota bacterium]